jgi:hypothetical protein
MDTSVLGSEFAHPYKDVTPPNREWEWEGYSNDQLLVRFGNGYGVSIIRGSFSYGGPQGLYELAVVKFYREGDEWALCYDTPITDDVIGYLNESDLPDLAGSVAELPPHLVEVR